MILYQSLLLSTIVLNDINKHNVFAMICYVGYNCIAAFGALSVQGYPGDFQTG